MSTACLRFFLAIYRALRVFIFRLRIIRQPVPIRSDSMNQMECPRSIHHSVSNQTSIKTGQLAVVRSSERQEVAIRDVCGIQKTRFVRMLPLKQRHIVRPKCMAGQLSQ